MDNDTNTLYIPMGVKTENEFFSGFGKKELIQALIGAMIGGVVSIIIFLVSGNVAYTMIGVLSGIAGSVMMTTKDQYNMSLRKWAILSAFPTAKSIIRMFTEMNGRSPAGRRSIDVSNVSYIFSL